VIIARFCKLDGLLRNRRVDYLAAMIFMTGVNSLIGIRDIGGENRSPSSFHR
jgi:hypothetical protein